MNHREYPAHKIDPVTGYDESESDFHFMDRETEKELRDNKKCLDAKKLTGSDISLEKTRLEELGAKLANRKISIVLSDAKEQLRQGLLKRNMAQHETNDLESGVQLVQEMFDTDVETPINTVLNFIEHREPTIDTFVKEQIFGFGGSVLTLGGIISQGNFGEVLAFLDRNQSAAKKEVTFLELSKADPEAYELLLKALLHSGYQC